MYKYLFIFLLLTTAALGHSWYPSECCSDSDCKPIACDLLTELPNGMYSYGNVTFSKDQVKSSLDGKCHVCISEYESGNKIPRCVFIQQSS